MNLDSKLQELILQVLARTMASSGEKIIHCRYKGILIPVIGEIADNLDLCEDQEVTNEQMETLCRSMEFYVKCQLDKPRE